MSIKDYRLKTSLINVHYSYFLKVAFSSISRRGCSVVNEFDPSPLVLRMMRASWTSSREKSRNSFKSRLINSSCTWLMAMVLNSYWTPNLAFS
jgi:hypothetical protein